MIKIILKMGAVLCLVGFASISAYGADVRVDADEGNFYLNLQFKTELMPADVIARLTDYENLKQVNPAIRESAIISQGGETNKVVWKKFAGCIVFVCRDLEHTEIVSHNENQINMVTIPEKSDFELGQSRWVIMPGATGSRIKYNSVLKPSFSLPPFIGTWIMKQKIKTELHETARLLGDLNSTH